MNNPVSSPLFCQYAGGRCEEKIGNKERKIFFAYASNPPAIAETIESAISTLREKNQDVKFISWKEMSVQGKVIFCQICKSIRTSSIVFADVTTLNFNLLFEIGFCIGSGIQVIPIKDTSYVMDEKAFAELGILDAIGYINFTNSDQLSIEIDSKIKDFTPSEVKQWDINRKSPLYLLRGPVNTEGVVQFTSKIKKSEISYREYDHIETPRLSLFEAQRQIGSSLGVIAHLLSKNRKGSDRHNGICAILCGMAMAQGKVVGMIQEENQVQPMDYRDIVQWYNVPSRVGNLLDKPIREIIKKLQTDNLQMTKPVKGLLAKLDLGDIAAENEVNGLKEYYVQTGDYTQAIRGPARLITGRKGTGKSAMFYRISSSLPRNSNVVLDLKPEGHQFARMKEMVLSKIPSGIQEHTLTAFWCFIVITEFAIEIIKSEEKRARIDSSSSVYYDKIKSEIIKRKINIDDDFSQRLMFEVNKFSENLKDVSADEVSGRLSSLVYGDIFGDLYNDVRDYLSIKEAAWLLVDNIDKGWPASGASKEDMTIIRCLLDAARKIQNSLSKKEIDFRCLIFLRSDIRERLMRETPDKGKDTEISLESTDVERFKAILRKRIEVNDIKSVDFDSLWNKIFISHVGSIESFRYIIDRTLMRPRDMLSFVQKCISIALNRDHSLILENDVITAEKSYSEDMLFLMEAEINDTNPGVGDLLYKFSGVPGSLTKNDISQLVEKVEPKVDCEKMIEILLWFGFLGILDSRNGDHVYSYTENYNMKKIMMRVNAETKYVVHQCFKSALDIQSL